MLEERAEALDAHVPHHVSFHPNILTLIEKSIASRQLIMKRLD